MELAFVVYLISILESFSTFLGYMCFISCLITFCLIFFELLDSGKLTHKKTFIFALILALLCGTVKALLPSEKNAYKIALAYGAQTIYQSEEAKRIGNKTLKLIEAKLDAMAEPEKEGKK